MKKLSILAAAPLAAAGIGLAAYTAPAYAAGATTLTQADVTAALADIDGGAHNGVTCFTGDICVLAANEYTLGEDLNFGDSTLFIRNNATVDLGGKTITSDTQTMFVSDATVTLKNGTIASTVDYAEALGAGNDTGTTNLTLNGITISDNNRAMFGESATVTLNGSSIGIMKAEGNVNLTINSGSYGSINLDNVTATINGGTFTGVGGASPVYVGIDADMAGTADTTKLTINDGTFTSAGDKGLEALHYGSIAINGGTFTGAVAGFGIGDYQGNITISGGTFKSTGSADNTAAITIVGTTDTSIADRLLAANHRYTNPSVKAVSLPGLGGGDYLFIGGTETSVTSGAAEEDSISAPKSGVMTSEAGSAAATLAPAAIVALGGAVAFAKAKSKKES